MWVNREQAATAKAAALRPSSVSVAPLRAGGSTLAMDVRHVPLHRHVLHRLEDSARRVGAEGARLAARSWPRTRRRRTVDAKRKSHSSILPATTVATGCGVTAEFSVWRPAHWGQRGRIKLAESRACTPRAHPLFGPAHRADALPGSPAAEGGRRRRLMGRPAAGGVRPSRGPWLPLRLPPASGTGQ